MRYRTIGNGRTAFDVSTLCLGTMNLGTRTDEATSIAILDRFIAAGGTFIDTANNYNAWVGGHGHDSEDLIGRAVAGRRKDFYLFTKVGHASGLDGKDWDLDETSQFLARGGE